MNLLNVSKAIISITRTAGVSVFMLQLIYQECSFLDFKIVVCLGNPWFDPEHYLTWKWSRATCVYVQMLG